MSECWGRDGESYALRTECRRVVGVGSSLFAFLVLRFDKNLWLCWLCGIAPELLLLLMMMLEMNLEGLVRAGF